MTAKRPTPEEVINETLYNVYKEGMKDYANTILKVLEFLTHPSKCKELFKDDTITLREVLTAFDPETVRKMLFDYTMGTLGYRLEMHELFMNNHETQVAKIVDAFSFNSSGTTDVKELSWTEARGLYPFSTRVSLQLIEEMQENGAEFKVENGKLYVRK